MTEKNLGIFNFLKIESPFNKKIDSVKGSLKQLQKLAIDNKDKFLFAKAGDNWVATYPYHQEFGSCPGTLTCQLLRKKEVAGVSKEHPIGDYYHPNMIYKMSVYFRGDEPVEIECVPELINKNRIVVEGDSETANILNLVLNPTRVERKVFEFPIKRKQHQEFEEQLPYIELITKALIENVEK